MNVDIAVGEVTWERELLAALAAHPDLDIGRRLVDLGTVDDATTPLIACPSVRGFSEERVRRIMATRPVVIIADSIRPPWLAEQGIDVHDATDADFTAIIAACAETNPSPRLQLVQRPNRGRITAFMGISGGVGVSTLVWLYGRRHPQSLLIDLHRRQPSLTLLCDQPRDGLLAALREQRRVGNVDIERCAARRQGEPAVLGLPIDHDPEFTDDEVWRLLVTAAEQFDDVVLDAGVLTDRTDLLQHVDRVVLVTTATPLGLIRLCARAAGVRPQVQQLELVVNRVRSSATGSRHATSAITALVRTELGDSPILVRDDVAACDRGWLTGVWDAALVSEFRLQPMQQVIGSNDAAIHRSMGRSR